VRPAGCSVGIEVSHDSGRTWTSFAGGFNARLDRVESNPSRPDFIVVSVSPGDFVPVGGLTRSTDGGTTWSPLSSDVQAIIFLGTIAPDNPSVVIGGRWLGGVVRSADSGDTWTVVNSGGFGEFIFAKASAETGTFAVYAIGLGGLWQSLDIGTTWSPISGALPPGGYGGYDLSASADRDKLFIVGGDGHLYEREIAVPTVEGIRSPSTPSVSGR
jgi:photosystem II stability/assembly factor-like uncharacterized protein